MAAQREKSAAVAVGPAHGAAVSGSPSPSSSSGGPAAASSSGERWSAAIGNLGELGANVDALQKMLGRKAVFVDDDIFSKASLAADQARTIKVYTYVLSSRCCIRLSAPVVVLPSLCSASGFSRCPSLKGRARRFGRLHFNCGIHCS
jgi:hypothetical protein